MLKYPYYIIGIESFFNGHYYYSYFTCALKDNRYYLISNLESYLNNGTTEDKIIDNPHSIKFISSYQSDRGYISF